jgi:predicted DNA-binding transcriptional regulator AlpA
MRNRLEKEPVYTLEEVLQLLRISHRTLHRWRQKGLFPKGFFSNFRGGLLWTCQEVDDWLATRNRGALTALTLAGASSASPRTTNR